MIGRILIFVCIAIMLVGSESKPTNGRARSVHKLKLTQAEINRGVSIQISAGPKVRKENSVGNFIPMLIKPRYRKDLILLRKGRRSAHVQKRTLIKPSSKFIKSLMPKRNATEKAVRAHEIAVLMPNVHLLRSKRSAPSKEMARDKAPQVEDLRNFNEDDASDEGDYFSEEETHKARKPNAQRKREQVNRQQEQSQQSKLMKSEDYRDYAFDTTDTDQFNDDDDLLRRFYGRHPAIRRAANDDYDSFSDLMHMAAAESDHDKRFVKRLHYGNQDRALNDDGNDKIDEENDTNDDDYNDEEYDSYDDY